MDAPSLVASTLSEPLFGRTVSEACRSGPETARQAPRPPTSPTSIIHGIEPDLCNSVCAPVLQSLLAEERFQEWRQSLPLETLTVAVVVQLDVVDEVVVAHRLPQAHEDSMPVERLPRPVTHR